MTRETDQFAVPDGPRLIVRLMAMIRTARIYDVSNRAFKRQLQEFMEPLSQLLERESTVTLVAISDYLYLNGARIRVEAWVLPATHALLAEYRQRSVGGIRFERGLSADELEKFFHMFMSADPLQAEHLFDEIAQSNLEHVHLITASEVEADDLAQSLEEPMQRLGGGGGSGTGGGRGDGDGNGDGDGDGRGDGHGDGHGDGGRGGDGGRLSAERGRAQQVFTKAVSGTRRIMLHAIRTRRPDLRFAKRLVQPVVDNIVKNEYSIVGLTALKSHDEYTYTHCVNVSTLSISIGHTMGMSRPELADLGVAALIHDVGKIMVPADVLRKPGRLTEEEWSLMHRHPLEGMKMMFQIPGLSELTLRSMRICLEHHMGADLSGYPHTPPKWEQAAGSRIVAMADCFDAMTAHRAYRKRPFTQYEALRRLLGPDRNQFDPAVRWAMIKTVGVYPAGTSLATDSGHVVVSISPNPEDPRRPNCRVLRRPDGTTLPEDAREYWEPMASDTRVTRVLSPDELPAEIAA